MTELSIINLSPMSIHAIQMHHVKHLTDWSLAEPVVLNLVVKAQVEKARSRQSERSRKHQSFITGMSSVRLSEGELAQRNAYLDEWRARIGSNE